MQIYIDTYGTYIHVKDGVFEFNIPKDDKIIKRSIAPNKISSIILSSGTTLTHSVVELAMINNIDIIFLESDGTPISRIWHSKLGSTTKIRKAQLVASMNHKAIEYVKKWLTIKLQNQIDFIKDLKKHRKEKTEYLDDRIFLIENNKKLVEEIEGKTIEDISGSLRGYEGVSGRLFFEVLSNVLIDEYKFNGRSTRPAQDQFNAFLNYAYGVLYSKVEKALIIAGIDPYLGFLHRDDYNTMSMVFDFIEPYRIFAEEVVFRLFSGKRVNKSHTDKIVNGYSLNKEGKNLLMQSFVDFFDEVKIRYKNKNQTRSNIIQYDAHTFANELINKTFKDEDIEKYDLLGDL
ncbi:MAG TPA: CRISPR-associated endonuclease Cas1 [Ignavibacteria bacterium]